MIHRRHEGEMMRQGLNWLHCPYGTNIAIRLWQMVFGFWYFPHRPFGQKMRWMFGWARVFALCGVEVDVAAHAIRINGVNISIDFLHAMTMPNQRWSYTYSREGNAVTVTMHEMSSAGEEAIVREVATANNIGLCPSSQIKACRRCPELLAFGIAIVKKVRG